MGGKFERDPSNADESAELLRYGFDLGFRLVDVAERYGEGLTEEIVGRALAGRAREEFFVISKVWKDHLRYDEVSRAAERSLRRLGTGYIDLYLIHWPSPEVPLAETMRALEELVARSLVRAIGVSNFDVPLMEEAQSHLRHTSLAANEVEYNLSVRSAEAEVIPFCKTHGIQFIAYRPFAKGALARTSLAEQKVRWLAEKYHKTPAQIALNWIIRQGITAIPKAGSRAHLEENWGAHGWKMTDEDARVLSRDSAEDDRTGFLPSRG